MKKNFKVSEPDQGSVSYPPKSLENKTENNDSTKKMRSHEEYLKEKEEYFKRIKKEYDEAQIKNLEEKLGFPEEITEKDKQYLLNHMQKDTDKLKKIKSLKEDKRFFRVMQPFAYCFGSFGTLLNGSLIYEIVKNQPADDANYVCSLVAVGLSAAVSLVWIGAGYMLGKEVKKTDKKISNLEKELQEDYKDKRLLLLEGGMYAKTTIAKIFRKGLTKDAKEDYQESLPPGNSGAPTFVIDKETGEYMHVGLSNGEVKAYSEVKLEELKNRVHGIMEDNKSF